MTTIDPTLLVVAAASATAWAAAGAARLPGARLGAVARGLLGGGVAFGLAVSAYGPLQIAGLDLRWDLVAGGGWTALGAAMLIGLAEEGAKLGGLALAARRGRRAGLVALQVALALSALLHGAGNLALAAPRYGGLGYAAALLAPVLALFLHLRRASAVPVPVPVPARRAGSPRQGA